MTAKPDLRAEVDRVFADRRLAQRRRIVEAIQFLAHYGRLNRADIERIGEVSTPQASIDLRLIQERMPDLMIYDRVARCYRPARQRKGENRAHFDD